MDGDVRMTPIICNHHTWRQALNESRTGVVHDQCICADCGETRSMRSLGDGTRCKVLKHEHPLSGWTDILTGKHCGSP